MEAATLDGVFVRIIQSSSSAFLLNFLTVLFAIQVEVFKVCNTNTTLALLVLESLCLQAYDFATRASGVDEFYLGVRQQPLVRLSTIKAQSSRAQ